MAIKKSVLWTGVYLIIGIFLVATILLYVVKDETSRTPTGVGITITYGKEPIPGGERINIVGTRIHPAWDQIKVQLSDYTDFWEWETATDDLDAGSMVTKDYGSDSASGITCWLNVTDVEGDGVVSSGDYFQVTDAFASGLTYTAVLIYTESGEKIGTGVTFSG